MKFDVHPPKINIEIPKYGVTMTKFDVPKIEPPELLFMKTKSRLPGYEDSVLAKMADDIKSSYEKQLNEISATLNEQLDMAKAETVAAKKEALISKIIAIVSLIVSVAIGVVQIFL